MPPFNTTRDQAGESVLPPTSSILIDFPSRSVAYEPDDKEIGDCWDNEVNTREIFVSDTNTHRDDVCGHPSLHVLLRPSVEFLFRNNDPIIRHRTLMSVQQKRVVSL